MKKIITIFLFIMGAFNLMVDEHSSSHLLEYQKVTILLLLIMIYLLSERFIKTKWFKLFYHVILCLSIFYIPSLFSLLGLLTLDLFYRRQYVLYPVLIYPIIYVYQYEQLPLIIILILSGMIGEIIRQKEQQEIDLISLLNEERRIRYDTENAKSHLMESAHKIERLTEIKERNRIAREIHDHIGHDIAGVLMQLQAADRVFDKDSHKSHQIIKTCINKLSITLELIRNTVYNIKPNQEINSDLFHNIIKEFTFCKIEFEIKGNLQRVKNNVLELLVTNLKEALTNAKKYAHATLIEIKIEVHSNYIRFYYQDNGIGCANIQEGLGISGMKERVTQMNGMMTIDGTNGFLLVCLIPLNETNIFREMGK